MQFRHARRVLAGASTAALLTLVALPTTAEADDQGRTTEAEDDTNESGESQHPSGRDRAEHQDRRQGEAGSDPDDDGRGPDRNAHGTDKPGATGGVYDGDQDGNNGCGNDQDFEDDNEGWCGRPDRDEDAGSTSSEAESETVSDAGTEAQAGTESSDGNTSDASATASAPASATEDDVLVLGRTLARTTPEQPDQGPTGSTGDSDVLAGAVGIPAEGDELGAPSSLPRTGVPIIAGLLTGLAGIGSGTAALRRSRR